MKVGNSASAGMGCARALLPVKISSAIDLRYPAALAGVCRLIIGLTRPRTVYAVRCDGPTAGRAIGLSESGRLWSRLWLTGRRYLHHQSVSDASFYRSEVNWFASAAKSVVNGCSRPARVGGPVRLCACFCVRVFVYSHDIWTANQAEPLKDWQRGWSWLYNATAHKRFAHPLSSLPRKTR